jgi:hypothetical protein
MKHGWGDQNEGGAHLEEMEAALPARVAAGASFLLAGKARTIQRLRHG